MKRFLILASFVLLLSLTVVAQTARADDTARNLRDAVRKLNTFLVDQPAAEAWSRALGLPALQTQAALGHSCDPGTLFQIYQQFNTGADGLDHPAFNDVNLAIHRHLEQLNRRSFENLQTRAAGSAFLEYEPVGIARMEQMRDVAAYDLKILRKYYKDRLSSRPRAIAYHTIDIDDLIPFLEEMEFELPPAISVGKLNQKLTMLQERRDKVEEDLDALPLEDISDDPSPDMDPLSPPQPDNEEEGQATDPPEITGPDSMEKDKEAQEEMARKQEESDKRKRLTRMLTELDKEINELKELRDEVAEKDKPRVDRRNENLRQLAQYNLGMEKLGTQQGDSFFLAARNSFTSFYSLYFFSTEDNLETQFDEQLKLISENAGLLANPESRRESAVTGAAAGWLDGAGLAGDLVTDIRAQHSLPNLEASVSSRFVNSLVGRTTSERRRIKQLILGRLTRGEATTSGDVTVDFVDDPNQANFSLHLTGNVQSDTYSRTRSIYAYTASTGQFESRRTILANVNGLIAGSAYGSASINSMLAGISSNIPLIQRLAAKTFAEDKGRGEAISAAQIKQESLGRFSEQTDDAISAGKKRLREIAMRGRSALLPMLFMRTSFDRLFLIGIKESMTELAAPIPSAEHIRRPDISLRVHETMLSNFINGEFAGRTLTNTELVDIAMERAEELNGNVPDALIETRKMQEENDESWSISFAEERPIQFEFSNNSFFITVFGRQFSQGRNRIRAGLSIRIKFLIKRRNGELRFVRDGRIEVELIDPEKTNARVVGFQSFLEGRLNQLTGNEEDEKDVDENEDDNEPQEIATVAVQEEEGILLPEKLLPEMIFENLEDASWANDLQLAQCRAEQGWFYLGWDHLPGSGTSYGSNAPVLMDTPAIWNEFTIGPGGGMYTNPMPGNSIINEPFPSGTFPANPLPTGELPSVLAPFESPN